MTKLPDFKDGIELLALAEPSLFSDENTNKENADIATSLALEIIGEKDFTTWMLGMKLMDTIAAKMNTPMNTLISDMLEEIENDT